jgi:hypothetical protein
VFGAEEIGDLFVVAVEVVLKVEQDFVERGSEGHLGESGLDCDGEMEEEKDLESAMSDLTTSLHWFVHHSNFNDSAASRLCDKRKSVRK